MVIAARNTAFPKVLSGRQRASGSTEQIFTAKARALGVEVSPLMVRKPARVFPWIGRNEEFFHVSWTKRKSLSLFGLLKVSWTKWGSGIFRKHPAFKVLMPLEGERAAHVLRALPEVEEMVVLEERRIDPILAVRVAEQWYEVYRWWQSPCILQDDCPLIDSLISPFVPLDPGTSNSLKELYNGNRTERRTATRT
jgi:hypothetical protein